MVRFKPYLAPAPNHPGKLASDPFLRNGPHVQNLCAPARQDPTRGPEGRQKGRAGPAGGGQPQQAWGGGSESIFIVGRAGTELWGGRTHRRKSCYEQQGACRPSRGRAWSAAAAPPPGPPESLPPQTPGQGASGMQEAVEGVVGRLQVKEHLAHLGVI